MNLFSRAAFSIAVMVGMATVPAFALANEIEVGAKANLSAKHMTLPTVMINGDGFVLVRGAKVTAVSTTTIQADSSWGASVIHWILNRTSSTNLLNSTGKSSAAEVKVGDTLSFSGMLSDAGSFIVNAKIIRDWSHPDSVSATSTIKEKKEARAEVRTERKESFAFFKGLLRSIDARFKVEAEHGGN